MPNPILQNARPDINYQNSNIFFSVIVDRTRAKEIVKKIGIPKTKNLGVLSIHGHTGSGDYQCLIHRINKKLDT